MEEQAMSYPHYDLVQRAHSELIAEGKIRRRTEQEDVEEDKGLLTRRAGYYSNTERDASIGILEKTSGNNSAGYSVDILIAKDGRFWDIATDAAGLAQPVDGEERYDPALAAKWAQPTRELAGITAPPQPGPGPIPGPIPTPGRDEILESLDEIIAMLQRAEETQARDTAMMIVRDDLNTERILDRIDEVVTNAEESGKKALAIYLAMNRPGAGAPPPGEELPIPPGDGNALLALLLKLLANRPTGGAR
jgi:hypothetical protein